jgi:16S rRNA A1518/A1519 N6-dimethyltransferase RsmA/KsgA/DIM1 with predicted DNA glycosylase/AP lyase activity
MIDLQRVIFPCRPLSWSVYNKVLEGYKFFSVNKLTQPLKMPYIFYQKLISDYSHKGSFVLEIGAGMGENTEFLLATEAKVCATDISEHSLSVIEKRFNKDWDHQ